MVKKQKKYIEFLKYFLGKYQCSCCEKLNLKSFFFLQKECICLCGSCFEEKGLKDVEFLEFNVKKRKETSEGKSKPKKKK